MSKKASRKVRISNSGINCYGSRVLTSGIDIKQYERNPILLWMHQRGLIETVIGTVINLQVDGDDLIGELVFDNIGDTSKLVSEKWDGGTLRMVSARFDIIELSDDPEFLLPGQTAFTVTRSKLVEVSVVDIGGNDDALPLVELEMDGKSLSLSSKDNSELLPLLKTEGEQTNQQSNNMDFKTIALKLGLPETATEVEILNAISVLLGYKTENEKLTQEIEGVKLSNITALVKGAVTARKIGTDKEAHFIELGKKVGVDTLKETFDSMSSVVKPTDITGAGVQLGGATGEAWKKLSEVPSEKLLELRENDKDTYMKLYKAEYGIDCKIEE